MVQHLIRTLFALSVERIFPKAPSHARVLFLQDVLWYGSFPKFTATETMRHTTPPSHTNLIVLFIQTP
jgi:hypothetical protein